MKGQTGEEKNGTEEHPENLWLFIKFFWEKQKLIKFYQLICKWKAEGDYHLSCF